MKLFCDRHSHHHLDLVMLMLVLVILCEAWAVACQTVVSYLSVSPIYLFLFKS